MTRKIFYSIILIVLTFCFFDGCASIISKSEYPVSISSRPQGAEITIVNRLGTTIFSGKTPTTVTLKAGAGYFKGENYTVTFKKEGYTPYRAQISRGVDGWYIGGNFFFGGLIGWLIVDPATGAMWTLEDLYVILDPQTASLQKEGLHIVTLDNVPDHVRTKMVKLD